MPKKAVVFEETYRDYLARLSALDLASRAEMLGTNMSGEEMIIPFYADTYRVSPDGIYGNRGARANLAVSVVLCQYILRCPDDLPEANDWVSFRDFKDSGPLTVNFANNTHRLIAQRFSGRLTDLALAGKAIGGTPVTNDLSYDLTMQFHALPRIPLYLLFNDKDDEFPAECSLLFKRSAEQYLDMECLTIVGTFLAGNLKQP
jgi:hypothetical protein